MLKDHTVTKYRCRYSRCSYSSTKKSRITDHNEVEHFECVFCGPGGELYSSRGYNAHLSSHNTHNSEVAAGNRTGSQKNLCRLAPKCPYTGPKAQVERHSRCLHMECPVNGCDAVLSKQLFFKHIHEIHRDQFAAQCPQDGCSITAPLVGYWVHALRHIDTDSEEHILHPAMSRCTFAPRCSYIGEKSNIGRHSLRPHLECPLNGCTVFLSKRLFFKHVEDKHGDQIPVQCPRDGCSSRDIFLGRYWHHVRSHIDKGDEEDVQGICDETEVEPQTAEVPPPSWEVFIASFQSSSQGMMQGECSNNAESNTDWNTQGQ